MNAFNTSGPSIATRDRELRRKAGNLQSTRTVNKKLNRKGTLTPVITMYHGGVYSKAKGS